MQFADAVAIYFSLPLMIAALSGLLIGEQVPPQRWVAIVVAFVGVAIITQPTSGVFNPATLIALFSTLCYAVGLMLTRPVGMRVPSAVMGLWQLMAFVTTGVILGLVFGSGAFHDPAHPSFSYLTQGWITPTPRHLLEMLAFGVAAALATILYTAGYKVVAPSFVAPFEYQSLIWASLWGFVMWGDVPGRHHLRRRGPDRRGRPMDDLAEGKPSSDRMPNRRCTKAGLRDTGPSDILRL